VDAPPTASRRRRRLGLGLGFAFASLNPSPSPKQEEEAGQRSKYTWEGSVSVLAMLDTCTLGHTLPMRGGLHADYNPNPNPSPNPNPNLSLP
jgi:hypothetical protein